jgi:hypothetical protein
MPLYPPPQTTNPYLLQLQKQKQAQRQTQTQQQSALASFNPAQGSTPTLRDLGARTQAFGAPQKVGTPQQQGPLNRGSETTGTGFVNLQTYLGLNQDKAQQMAGQLAGGVAEKGEAAKQGQADLQAKFGADRDASVKSGEQSQWGRLSDQQQFGHVQQQSEQAAKQANQLAGGFGQRQDLVNQQFGKGNNYTSGMGKFDNFLAGSGEGQFAAAKDKYGGLAEALGVADTQSAQQMGDINSANRLKREYAQGQEQATAQYNNDAAAYNAKNAAYQADAELVSQEDERLKKQLGLLGSMDWARNLNQTLQEPDMSEEEKKALEAYRRKQRG